MTSTILASPPGKPRAVMLEFVDPLTGDRNFRPARVEHPEPKHADQHSAAEPILWALSTFVYLMTTAAWVTAWVAIDVTTKASAALRRPYVVRKAAVAAASFGVLMAVAAAWARSR
ncbi:hypothetical protein [Amycolatopsis sp. NPDC059657]|uniref:hypothetical protein n=1 Tax=Amycolatopsis sp. NPDC059657 TaxID=3346899 RepID=UPI00366B2F24